MRGTRPIGSISLGRALVIGSIREPRPATGITAFRIGLLFNIRPILYVAIRIFGESTSIATSPRLSADALPFHFANLKSGMSCQQVPHHSLKCLGMRSHGSRVFDLDDDAGIGHSCGIPAIAPD